MTFPGFLCLIPAFGLVFSPVFASQSGNDIVVHTAIDKLCTHGNVYHAESDFRNINDNAQAYHSLAALELILHGSIDRAVELHKMGKATDSATIPPLAKRHIDKLECAGLDELFFVTAVIIKELVDSNSAAPNVLKALKTLITLTSDVGLDQAAESLLVAATTLFPTDTSLLFRAAVLTPGVYGSLDHIGSTRALLEHRINRISDAYSDLTLTGLDEFVLSPTFYFVYQGYNDKDIMTKLQYGYTAAYPRLGSVEIMSNVQQGKYLYQQRQHTLTTAREAATAVALPHPRKIRVGFVSSYFRRHSICKLFCGIMTNLDKTLFEVFAFSAMRQNEEDKVTLSLRHSHINFVSIGMTFIQNRNEVTDRYIDILVYLDVGMDPSIAAWAVARLAPVQMVIWGHPSTTGYASIDYYLSSEKFHRHPYSRYSEESSLSGAVYASDAFAEQLVQFDTLGFYFERPSLEANISMIGVAIEEETPSADAHADTEIEQTAHAAAVGVTPTVERAENVPFFRKRDRLSPEEVALVHRPMAYYKVLRAKLRTYKTVAASQIVKLINAKLAHNASIALCPQHMPKFHPDFDAVLTGILIHSPNTRIALIDNRKKMQWRLTLTQRWRLTLTEFLTLSAPTESDIGAESSVSVQDTVDSLLSRIVWISAMSPQEYLHLLAVGDVMLDPFPFGGGVTTLESVAVCTPVVTLPSAQSVPQLAAGMLYHTEMSTVVERTLVVPTVKEYLHSTLSMLRAAESGEIAKMLNITHSPSLTMLDIRREVCKNFQKLYSNLDTLHDWNIFLSAAL